MRSKTVESRTMCRFPGKVMIVVHSPRQEKGRMGVSGLRSGRIVNLYIMNTCTTGVYTETT